MINLYNLETQIQQALLQNAVEIYKQQQPEWFNDLRIKKAVLGDAFWGWQSLFLLTITALMIAALLLVLHAAWVVTVSTILVVIMGGLFIEALWLWLSVNNKQCQTKAITKLLSSNIIFSLDTIYDKRLKTKLFKALHYWSLINEKTQTIPQGPLHNRLLITRNEITRWLQHIYKVVQQADHLQCNAVIKHDLQKLPAAIQQNEAKLLSENNIQTQQHLEQILSHQRRQLQTLKMLQNNIQQTHHQLDKTLSTLGMVYSQLLLITENRHWKQRLNRLQADVTAEIDHLQDIIEVMDEFRAAARF